MAKGMDKMIALLEQEDWARERKNKYEAIAVLLLEKYPNLKWAGSERAIADIVFDACREDRYWRRVTQLHPELRGKDYETNKEELEAEAQEDLGYTITP